MSLKWSNGIPHERSPRKKCYEEEREYVNPVARALNDNETWTVDDSGTFFPTIPYSIETAAKEYSNT